MSYKECSATSRRTGEKCKARAVKGRDVCYHHGGNSRVGVASGTYTDGRHSKYMPERLRARYDESRADTEILALREDVALIDARLSDLLSRVDTGESGTRWEALKKAWRDYGKAKAGGKQEKIDEALFSLEDAIEQGSTDYEAWAEIGSQLEQRRKLVESERKRLIEMQQMIRTDEAMVLITAVVHSVRKHVRDESAITAIAADVARITGPSST